MPNEALESIKAIVKGFKTLTILTLVTDIQIDAAGKATPTHGTAERGCYTEIDLVGGDIKNYIGAGLGDEEYDRVTKFHATQVEKGQQVIQNTIGALKDAAKLIKELTTS